MTPPIALGTLESVDLRQVWITEAGDFTPWLAKEENLAEQDHSEEEWRGPRQPDRLGRAAPMANALETFYRVIAARMK